MLQGLLWCQALLRAWMQFTASTPQCWREIFIFRTIYIDRHPMSAAAHQAHARGALPAAAILLRRNRRHVPTAAAQPHHMRAVRLSVYCKHPRNFHEPSWARSTAQP